ncbi:MAG: flagellin [Deltaproteobacteria bacterium]|nr:flagellin [Deltaproteobacteria bacterium]
MTLRINTNIPAMKVSRHLSNTEKKLAESLIRLSSGFKINKGADDPSGLVISEQMRAQIAGIQQAIENSEVASSMVQTAESALNEVNKLLLRMRELSLHAANEGANDIKAIEADQTEVEDILDSIGLISRNTEWGNRKLLDGSTGATGEAIGDGMTFLRANENTVSSPNEGYQVEITRVATRAYMAGDEEIDESNLPGMRITLYEGGKTVQLNARDNDTPISFFGRLRAAVDEAGLKLDLFLSPDNTLTVVHREYGSQNSFQAASSIAGVLSEDGGVVEAAIPGEDVAGTINGEGATGRGQVLTGNEGNVNTDGLSIRYSGPLTDTGLRDPQGNPVLERTPQTGQAGAVHVFNNALEFQVGGNADQSLSVLMPFVRPDHMGREVETVSGYDGLIGINLRSPQGARDAIRLIDSAIDDLTLSRGKLGAFHRNNLDSHIATLRVTAENLMAAESTIRDADVAKEVAEYTKNRILFDTGMAMAAQANQVPANVIKLIQ